MPAADVQSGGKYDGPMRSPTAGIVVGLAVGLGACGGAGSPPPPACGAAASAALEQALASAPAAVRLAGGTAISVCVARARTLTQLERIGGLVTGAADRLAVRAVRDPQAALELGYLIGATRRGAALTNGLASQLQTRVEAAGALRGAGAAPLAALHRGILAGQASG